MMLSVSGDDLYRDFPLCPRPFLGSRQMFKNPIHLAENRLVGIDSEHPFIS
jgi:hypothetical protein